MGRRKGSAIFSTKNLSRTQTKCLTLMEKMNEQIELFLTNKNIFFQILNKNFVIQILKK
jgi:hypothetical protein